MGRIQADLLLVEPNQPDQEALERLVATEMPGCTCVVAASLLEARNALASRTFGAVIVDSDGNHDSLLELVAGVQNTPVICIMRPDSKELSARIVAAGVDDFLIKDDQGLCLEPLPLRLALVFKRRQEQETLRTAKDQLQTIFDDSPAAMYLVDIDHRFVLVNRQNEALFGVSRDRVIGQTPDQLFPEQVAEQFVAHHRHVIVSRKPMQFEEVFSQQDGWHTYLSLHSPLFDARGEIQAVYCISTDITERKRIEEALKLSEQQLRHITDNMLDMIIQIDPSGIIQYASPACQDFLGFKAENLMGQSFFSSIHPDDVKRVKTGILETDLLEYRFKRADGRYIWLQTMGNLLYTDGVWTGAVFSGRDITARKQMEDELRVMLEKQKELSELKSRFVATVSHEFRTPLAIVQNAIDNLRYYADRMTDPQKHARMDKIQAQIQRVTALLDEVLTLDQMEARTAGFTPEPLNLEELIKDIALEFKRSWPAHHLVYTSSDAARRVTVDRKLIGQIIANLLSNAGKFSPAGSTVSLDVAYTDDATVLRVKDAGIGIPEQDQAHLFEEFHRAGNVGAVSGAGLNLSIVKHAVSLHGGTIAADSTVGVGSTFTVVIPDRHVEDKESQSDEEDTRH